MNTNFSLIHWCFDTCFYLTLLVTDQKKTPIVQISIKILSKEMALDEIYLLPNMVGSQTEGWKLYKKLNDVCVRFLGESVHYLTSIEEDEMVLRALKKYQSVIEMAPGSAASRDFMRLAEACTHLRPIDQASGGMQFFMERLILGNPSEHV